MLLTMLRSLVPRSLKQSIRRYYESGFKREFGVRTVEESLGLLRRSGFQPTTAIDVGAFRGEWARLCKGVFPQCRILMVEPQPRLGVELEALACSRSGLDFASALLGALPKDAVPFFEDETASSVLADAVNHTKPPTILPMTTLEMLTRGTPFERPSLIKLDVQGYELEVLKGGESQLQSADAVLMEVNFIKVYAGAPLLHDVVSYMHARGLRAFDISSIYRRPFDDALFQLDMLFVRESSPLFGSLRWN